MSIKEKLENVPVTRDLFEDLSEAEIKTNDILAQIALQFLNYRKKHSLSQKELAEKLGVSQALVSRWERSEHNFTIANLVNALTKLNIEVDIAFEKKIACKFPLKEDLTPKIFDVIGAQKSSTIKNYDKTLLGAS